MCLGQIRQVHNPEIRFGGGQRKCEKCGETHFGSTEHFCRKEEKPKEPKFKSIEEMIEFNEKNNKFGDLLK